MNLMKGELKALIKAMALSLPSKRESHEGRIERLRLRLSARWNHKPESHEGRIERSVQEGVGADKEGLRIS